MLKWSLEDGAIFVRALQTAIHPSGYHAGLAGSVLHKGSSEKDIDILIFPFNTAMCDREELVECLTKFGLRLRFTSAQVKAFWRRAGSQDQKEVEVWETKGGNRVDLFFLK